MAHTFRTLQLKHARFKSGRKKDFIPPALDQLLLRVKAAAPQFGQRHYPPPTALPAGTPCVFLNRIEKRSKGAGVLIEVYSYMFGSQSDQLRPDFTKAQPDVKSGPIIDAQGQTREIVHSYRCVILGQSVLVEYNGRAGGLDQLAHLLAHVFNTYCEKLPSIEFLDVAASDLEKAIKAGGGVDRIELSLLAGNKPASNFPFARKLSDIGAAVTGAKQVKVVWDTDDNTISPKTAVQIAQEFESEETNLETLTIQLKEGGIIKGLDKYKEKRRIQVQVVPGGKVAVSEIEEGLWNYLDELRMVQGKSWRVIDDQGNFVAAKAISFKAKS